MILNILRRIIFNVEIFAVLFLCHFIEKRGKIIINNNHLTYVLSNDIFNNNRSEIFLFFILCEYIYFHRVRWLVYTNIFKDTMNQI